jgi:hypothetical protein
LVRDGANLRPLSEVVHGNQEIPGPPKNVELIKTVFMYRVVTRKELILY